jgi:hypothetical protein
MKEIVNLGESGLLCVSGMQGKAAESPCARSNRQTRAMNDGTNDTSSRGASAG